MVTQLQNDLEKLEANETTIFDLIFRDSNGNIAIFQKPNFPALMGSSALFVQFFLPDGTMRVVFILIAFGTLYAWAWLETFQGVNYFRRSLGLITLVSLITLGTKLSGG